MKKVGIITLYRGYNYGTSLQAYALKSVIREMGYDAEILWTKENAHSGRDIRIGKIIRIMGRVLVHPELCKQTLNGYRRSLEMPLDAAIKDKFLDFEKTELHVKGLSRRELRQYARSGDTQAVVCGSDQIWSAAGANVEPLYYLRFVPDGKRVAYAPSFGASHVPDYNKKIIKKYLSDFSRISVREPQGVQILESLTGRTAPVVLDPTFLLRWEQWKTKRSEPYLLLYFLNEPSEAVVKAIVRIQAQEKCRIYALPYRFNGYKEINDIEYISAGPKDFVNLIRNAKCVFTDSFHGTALSINLNVPFWTFARNYGSGVAEQSSRITAILDRLTLSQQYVTTDQLKKLSIPQIDFDTANSILTEQRKHSQRFLRESLESAI